MAKDKAKNGSAIGYGKPPIHSRFKKGVSGNPTGRPKREPGVQNAICRLLDQPISKQKNLDTEKLKGAEALAISLLRSALRGSAKHAGLILKIEARRADTIDALQPDPDQERAIAENAIKRLGKRRTKR